jgi:O-antigen/teichoic acid export membrane protein
MMSFSLSVYVITLTNIIISQAHQLIVSLCLGVAVVAVLQAGNKFVVMFGNFTP